MVNITTVQLFGMPYEAFLGKGTDNKKNKEDEEEEKRKGDEDYGGKNSGGGAKREKKTRGGINMSAVTTRTMRTRGISMISE